MNAVTGTASNRGSDYARIDTIQAAVDPERRCFGYKWRSKPLKTNQELGARSEGVQDL
jgi:hypothetical protein